jgi:hypothetical protein
MTREEAMTAVETWAVFKNVTPTGDPDECPEVWGLLLAPGPKVILLTTDPNDGYTLLNGEHHELDETVWAIADLCQ